MILKSAKILLAVMLFSSAYAASAQIQQAAHGHDSSQPIKITSDNLEVLQDQHIAIFTGNVVAVQGETTLKSEVMKVHYRSNDDSGGTAPGQKKPAPKPAQQKPASASPTGNSSISQIDVEKNVFITMPDESAQGDDGIYDVDNHMIKLNGHVILVKNKNIIKGEHLVYDTESGKSQVFSASDKTKPGGRVESVFIPKSNDATKAPDETSAPETKEPADKPNQDVKQNDSEQ